MKIGAMVESFRLGFRGGVEKAAALGAEGIQAFATTGELAPEKMSPARIREVLDIVHSNGIVFSALCGDYGYGFNCAEKNPEFIDKSKRILDLSLELGCGIVTTHIAHIGENATDSERELVRSACRELAEYADAQGAVFAIETGSDRSDVLAEFLDSLGAEGVRVNFDPANLVMCQDERPEFGLEYIGKYIVHTHAKDGIMLKKKVDAKLELDDMAKEHAAMIEMGHKYLELPLGEGDVNFDTYLPALKDSGFDGFLTIEREVGDNPVSDITLAVDFLRDKIAKFKL